ncbi:MAG: cytochrome c biogenesis protein ResB [Planctomycetota bacterium]
MAKKPNTLPEAILAQLGSFWLAIACLVNLFLLTWLGTLEQVEKGIHQVQVEYFESWVVAAKAGPLKLLLPGGYITMGLLTLNLLIGGLVRIRKSKATIGVIIAHVGIAVMMLGGLLEHAVADYGRIILHEGEEGDEFQEYAGWEVAIWDADATAGIQEYIIPEEQFADLAGPDTRTFRRADLPFDLVLGNFLENCEPRRAAGIVPTAPVYEDLFLSEKPRDKEEERNIAGLYATAITEQGTSVQKSFLFGVEQFPWVVEAGGKNWAVELRHTVHPMPFRLRLVKFTKEDHPGMAMARAYSSDVVRIDPDGSEHPVRIEMNKPLREKGLVIYQASYGPQNGMPGEPYSVLAVSRNPSDRVPWIAVTIIAIGLVWTFLARLIGFVGKEKRRSAKAKKTVATEGASPKAAA